MGAFPPVKGATALEMRALALNVREERTLRQRKKLNEMETVNVMRQLDVDERKMKQRFHRLHKKTTHPTLDQHALQRALDHDDTPCRALQASRTRNHSRTLDLAQDELPANRLQRQVARQTQRGVYRSLLAEEKAKVKADAAPLLVQGKGFSEFADSIRRRKAVRGEEEPSPTLTHNSPTPTHDDVAARSPQGRRRMSYLQDKLSTSLRSSWDSVSGRSSARPLASSNDSSSWSASSRMSERELFERKRRLLIREEARRQSDIRRRQEDILEEMRHTDDDDSDSDDDQLAEDDAPPEQEDAMPSLHHLRHCRYLRSKHVLTPDMALVSAMFEQQMYLSKVQLWKVMAGSDAP